jgi:cytochrome c oxidase cbb3-type subunit 3
MSRLPSLAPLALFLFISHAFPQQPPGAAGASGAGRGGGRGSVVAEITGDAKAGEAFFNGAGKCTGCHSATGDLKGVGSRMNPTILQGRMVYPRGSGTYGAPNTPQGAKPDKPLIATITTPDGKTVKGDVVEISDFIVTVKQADGAERTFTRNGDTPRVAITDPLQAHIDLLLTMTDKTMHDLTAYLVTLK